MTEAVIGPLVGRLQELALSEARKLVTVDDNIRSLRDKLMWMQAFLRDAGPRRRVQNNELIRVYLQQTRDAVFDAEDAIDQYFLRVDLSRFPQWSRAALKFFTGFITQVRVRHALSRRIKLINARLESIIENKEKYKMDGGDTMEIIPWRPSTTMSATAEKLEKNFLLPLVGRDDKLQKLDTMLKKETKNPMVITVVGKSGVGKTMLVKEMYNRLSTKDHFDVQEWASFAPNLSASNIIRLILLRLQGSVTCTKKELVNILKKELEKKSYLLVIDGEVSNTEWKRILDLLPSDNARSRVVRTTQTTPEESPSEDFKHDKIELDHFDQEISIELFLKIFFMEGKNEKHNGHSSLVATREKEKLSKAVRRKYAKKIFQVTDGLPLAVVLLSGLLRTKEYPGEWNKLFEHLRLKAKELKRLDIILSMCFDDLPHDLKSCFLYFAALPVNSLIRARTLVCMWMAEGFLRPREGKTMEQVGEHYLKELIHRYLVILPPEEYESPGDERVTVQTKVHDFLITEAQEASFVEIHSGDDVPTLSTARRLSLQSHRDKYAALSNPLPKLRSILSNFEKEEPGNAEEVQEGEKPSAARPSCLPRRKSKTSQPNPKDLIRQLLHVSQFLRVISLDGLEVGSELPSEIGDVVHLQYLGITSCSLQKIPRKIGKLKCLQALDVRGTKVSTLPIAFWRIRTLRHVFGSLLHLPKRVGELQQLQTLTSVTVTPADDWDEKNLGNMKRLQVLRIRNLSASNLHALLAVCKLKYLVVLNIYGEKITQDLFTSPDLSRLQVMDLEGEMIEVPLSPQTSSIRFNLPNLTTLYLENTKVTQNFIDKLSELPFLSTLALYPHSCKEKRILFTQGFKSLNKLTLDVEMTLIEIKGKVFPHIVILEIFTYVDLKDFKLTIDIPEKDMNNLRKKITLARG